MDYQDLFPTNQQTAPNNEKDWIGAKEHLSKLLNNQKQTEAARVPTPQPN